MSHASEALLSEVTRHWASQGLRPAPGVRAEQIEAFEHRYHVTMPDDLRAYFSYVNGVEGGQSGGMDDAQISFWSLSEVRSVAEETGDVHGHDLFVIADYSLWVHAYAVRVLAARPNSSEVFLVGGPVPERVADSFDAFLRGYLANDETILYGAGKQDPGSSQRGRSG